MLRRIFLTAPIAIFISAMALPAAAKSSDDGATFAEVEKEIAQAGKAVRDYSVAQRDEAIEVIESALESIDNRIAMIEQRIDDKTVELSVEARTHARAAVRDLRAKREQVAEWYGGLKHGSAEAWEEIKRGFSKAYDDLRTSLSKAEKQS